MNLSELLSWLKKEGAPDEVIRALESTIERRRLRIERREAEIRRWLEERQRQQDEKSKAPDLLLLLFLVLLADADRDTDEVQFSDLFSPRFRFSTTAPQDRTGFFQDDQDEDGAADDFEELPPESRSLAAPKW